jgi:inosine-uridine nucleoside N-ribohydrolase
MSFLPVRFKIAHLKFARFASLPVFFFGLLFSLVPASFGGVCLGEGLKGWNIAGDTIRAIPIIFETDMGNDVDDALALDMLYKYMDEGKVRLLAVSSNKDNVYSGRFIRLMNNWYGYPKIPVGAIVKGPDCETDSRNYAQAACEYVLPGSGVLAFKKELGAAGEKGKDGAGTEAAGFTESTALYRRILASQPDHSVVIVSVGFSTNLARLLDTKGDQYSALSGRELVSRKVRLLSMMAGNFEGKPMAEYNVMKDAGAAGKVFSEWPTPIVTSPFELGKQVLYPASVIETGFAWTPAHPVVVAYKSYLPMPYDRPCWDPTAVLYAVEGGSWFRVSQPGFISVDNQGITSFTANPAGNRRYLETNPAQADRIKNRLIQLTTTRPRYRRGATASTK